MKEINMGGFENQRIGVTFAGTRYEIELDAPVEIYRKFLSLPKGMKTENDWNKTKSWMAEFIAVYNDINRKKFKESLTKVSVINFLQAYNDLLMGIANKDGDSKKVVNQKKTKAG